MQVCILCFIPYVHSRNFFCISQTLCDQESSFKTKVLQGSLRGPCGPCRWTAFLPNLGPQFLKASGFPSHLCASQFQVSAALSLPLTPSYMPM